MAKIIGIGETIYNVTMKDGKPTNGMPSGDIFNTMISLGRSGVDASLISEVADDRLGKQIIDFMQQNGVNTDNMYQFEGRTPLSLAHLAEDGSAEYDYYVHYPTSGRLDVVWPRIDKEDILYFGSLYVLNEEVHPITMDLVNFADARNALIVYTPDVHKLEPGHSVWLMPKIIDGLEKANLIVMSTVDMQQLYKESDVDKVYQNNVRFYCPVFVAWEADGIKLRTVSVKKNYPAPAYPADRNMIGVKDAFNAGLLYELGNLGVTRDSIKNLSEGEWDRIMATASNFAADVAGSADAFVGKKY